jgi:hypothetical protein
MAFTKYGDVRMSICKTCDDFNNIMKTCKVCGCFMPAKVEFKDQKCPKNPPMWDVINESNYEPPGNCCGQ